MFSLRHWLHGSDRNRDPTGSIVLWFQQESRSYRIIFLKIFTKTGIRHNPKFWLNLEPNLRFFFFVCHLLFLSPWQAWKQGLEIFDEHIKHPYFIVILPWICWLEKIESVILLALGFVSYSGSLLSPCFLLTEPLLLFVFFDVFLPPSFF